jgi:hypothetical protein
VSWLAAEKALPTAQTELHLEPPAAFGVIRRRPEILSGRQPAIPDKKKASRSIRGDETADPTTSATPQSNGGQWKRSTADGPQIASSSLSPGD